MSPSSFSVIVMSPGVAVATTELDESDSLNARPARIGPYSFDMGILDVESLCDS